MKSKQLVVIAGFVALALVAMALSLQVPTVGAALTAAASVEAGQPLDTQGDPLDRATEVAGIRSHLKQVAN